MEKFISESASDTVRIGKEFAKKLKAGDAVLYRGDMGGGMRYF